MIQKQCKNIDFRTTQRRKSLFNTTLKHYDLRIKARDKIIISSSLHLHNKGLFIWIRLLSFQKIKTSNPPWFKQTSLSCLF